MIVVGSIPTIRSNLLKDYIMEQDGIYGFKGKTRFLSNFADCKVIFDGVEYPTTENAYQAAKTLNKAERKIFETLSPFDAKQMGRKITVRNDWQEVNLQIMFDLNLQKFQKEPYKRWLQETGDKYIEETNTWGDAFWGVCNGVGENHLGKILMRVRDEL